MEQHLASRRQSFQIYLMKKLLSFIVLWASFAGLGCLALYYKLPVANAQSQSESPPSLVQSTNGINVIDVARLVLETTKEQSENNARMIQVASTVVVVMFSLVAAFLGFFGWNKLIDMENAANNIVKQFNADTDDLTNNLSKEAVDFKEGVKKKIEENMTSLHNEMIAQSEFIFARTELNGVLQSKVIFEAGCGSLSAAEKAVHLNNFNADLDRVVARLVKALESKDISNKVRIRGLADAAYAVKRRGDAERALTFIDEALKVVDPKSNDMTDSHALLSYNAACYSAMLNKDDSIIENYLRQSIKLSGKYLEIAKSDEDFSTVKSKVWFQTLIYIV